MGYRVVRTACLAVGALVVSVTSTWAQTTPEPLANRVYAWTQTTPDTLQDRVRVDLATKRSGVTTKALLLDKAEREVFWPVYEAYERDWTRLNTEREELLNEYVSTADKVDDTTAEQVLARFFQLEEDRLAALKKYAADLRQKLPAELAVKFIQAELQIQQLTEIQLSSRFPDFR
jgi:hypothetical protein